MAKTTSTTKAKTKTSSTKKKPVSKAVSKSNKSVSTKSKTASRKVVAKKAPTKTSSKTAPASVKKSTRSEAKLTGVLNRAQILLGVAYAAMAGLAGYFMNTESAQVLLGHLTKDELASRAGTVLAPAAHVLYEVEFRWLIVAMLTSLALFAVLRGTRYFVTDQAAVASKVAPFRWIDHALTGAFGFTIVALLNGLQDAVALKLGVVSLVVAAYLAWVFEREAAATGKPAKSTFVASAALSVIPVLMLAVTMYGTWMYGMVRSPWYAYASAAVFALGLLLITRIQWRNRTVLNYSIVDQKFGRVAILTKLTLAAILIVGLYK